MQFLFLVNWLVSTAQTMSHADFVIDIDTLSKSADYQSSTRDAFAKHGFEVNFSDCSIDSARLSDMRPEVEGILNAAVKSILPHQVEMRILPARVKERLSGLDEVSLHMLRRLAD